MEIKLDKDAVAEIVKAAILDQLGDEGRSKLIEEALAYLLTEPAQERYTSFKTPSPLQTAFNEAAALAARSIVSEMVADDPAFIARVKEKVGEAMALVDEAQYSSYVADALGEALRRSR